MFVRVRVLASAERTRVNLVIAFAGLRVARRLEPPSERGAVLPKTEPNTVLVQWSHVFVPELHVAHTSMPTHMLGVFLCGERVRRVLVAG